MHLKYLNKGAGGVRDPCHGVCSKVNMCVCGNQGQPVMG